MYQQNIEDEELEVLRSLSQEVKRKLTSRDNFTIFGEYIASNFTNLGELSLMMKWILLNSKLSVSQRKPESFPDENKVIILIFHFCIQLEFLSKRIHIQTQEVAVEMVLVPLSLIHPY